MRNRRLCMMGTAFFVFFLFILSFLGAASGAKKKKTGMVLIPAGEFMMGLDEKDIKKIRARHDYDEEIFEDEKPKHKVYLDAYFIDKYEVTNAQYKKCVKAGKCRKPPDTTWYNKKKYANNPVMDVDWNMANAYCTWARKRLPTEAEWEKAARGTQGYLWPCGNTWDAQKSNTWGYYGPLQSKMPAMPGMSSSGTDAANGTLPVGSFESGKSSYSVYDMIGNVGEWVSDWYDENYYKNSPYKNPKGPNKGEEKVCRGGSFDRISMEDVWGAYRGGYAVVGFRCAKDAK